jgi:hypothetical protein
MNVLQAGRFIGSYKLLGHLKKAKLHVIFISRRFKNLRPKLNIQTNIPKVAIIDPEIDPRWNKFVENHPYGLICHLSEWKQVLENSFNHMKGYYFVLNDNSENKIQAALPVYLVKSIITGRRLVSIPYATLCDPLVSNDNEFNRLSNAAIELLDHTKSSFAEIRTLKSYPLLEQKEFIDERSFKHHYIKLESSIEEIKKGFHKKSVKSAINKSMKSGLKIIDATNEKELKVFYQLYFNTRIKLSLPPQPYKYFKNIWNAFSHSGKFCVLMAMHNNQPVGGLGFFKYKGRVSTEFAGWDTDYKAVKPNHFLYWEAIKKAYKEGYKVFDFGRTSCDNLGLLKFKKHWGTIETDLPQFYYPKSYKKNSLNQSWIKKKWIVKNLFNKKIPKFCIKIMADFCYRHLG